MMPFWTNLRLRQRPLHQVPKEQGHPPTDLIPVALPEMYPLLEGAGVDEEEEGAGVEDGDGHVTQEVRV